jgi:hypothetical protein
MVNYASIPQDFEMMRDRWSAYFEFTCNFPNIQATFIA